MTDIEKTNEAPNGPSASKAMLGNAKLSLVYFLLRFLRHHPGMVIDQGRRKYIVRD